MEIKKQEKTSPVKTSEGSLEEQFDTYSSEVSKLGRQLTLAFIAVIWLYSDQVLHKIPSLFKINLLLSIIYLTLDFVQYATGTVAHHIYENKQKLPTFPNRLINWFFYGKLLILSANGVLLILKLITLTSFF
jgi:hypothetical protein